MAYSAPSSLPEALAILRDDGPRIIAGCTDFFPGQRIGRQDRNIIDITRIDGLRGITRTAEGWRIGAATTWTDVARAPLPPAFDALRRAARQVGSLQIQNSGTVAGNICNASPAADGIPPLLALDAEIEIASAAGSRRVPLWRFVTGVRKVDLAPGEMAAAIHVPTPPAGEASAFLKLGSRKYLVISIAMVAANVMVENDRVARARVAVGACSPVARRLPALEELLRGVAVADIAGLPLDRPELLFAQLSPIDDVRGSAAYRIDAVAELCRRSVLEAATSGG